MFNARLHLHQVVYVIGRVAIITEQKGLVGPSYTNYLTLSVKMSVGTSVELAYITVYQSQTGLLNSDALYTPFKGIVSTDRLGRQAPTTRSCPDNGTSTLEPCMPLGADCRSHLQKQRARAVAAH